MKKTLTLLAFLIVLKFANAQNIQVSLTVITQPCTNNGEVQINASGGTPPYSYYVNAPYNTNGATPTLNGNIISGLPPGYLYVAATDANGFFDTDNIVLTAPFQTTITSSPAICPALGEIQINNVGSAPFLNELYLNGTLISSNAPFINLPPAIYFVNN